MLGRLSQQEYVFLDHEGLVCCRVAGLERVRDSAGIVGARPRRQSRSEFVVARRTAKNGLASPCQVGPVYGASSARGLVDATASLAGCQARELYGIAGRARHAALFGLQVLTGVGWTVFQRLCG